MSIFLTILNKEAPNYLDGLNFNDFPATVLRDFTGSVTKLSLVLNRYASTNSEIENYCKSDLGSYLKKKLSQNLILI